MLNVCTLTVKV